MTLAWIEGRLAAIERWHGWDIRRVDFEGTSYYVAADLVQATLPNDELVEFLKNFDAPVQWRSEKTISRSDLAEIATTNDAAADLCLYLEQQAQQAAVNAFGRRRAAA